MPTKPAYGTPGVEPSLLSNVSNYFAFSKHALAGKRLGTKPIPLLNICPDKQDGLSIKSMWEYRNPYPLCANTLFFFVDSYWMMMG